MPADLSQLIVRLVASNTRKVLAMGAGALVAHGLAQSDEAQRLSEELFGVLAGSASIIWGSITQAWQAKLLVAANQLPAGSTPQQVRKRAGELAFADVLSRVHEWIPSRAEIKALTDSDIDHARQLESLWREIKALSAKVQA